MSLPKYFQKDALAISHTLNTTGLDPLIETLNSHLVGIVFDDQCKSKEGMFTLELSVRLLSRLYPKLVIKALSEGLQGIETELMALAKSINENIEFVDSTPGITVVIGQTTVSSLWPKCRPVYIGSDYWLSKLSGNKPVSSGKSNLPFAAGYAACLGASHIFRYVFADFLSESDDAPDIEFSLIDLTSGSTNSKVNFDSLDLGEFALVGLGAIGNGCLWSLGHFSQGIGQMTLIDHESISTTNLQRYILPTEDDIDKEKTKVATTYVSAHESSLELKPFSNTWETFLGFDPENWNQELILLAVDNEQDRIEIQASLPKHIINAYTGPKGMSGISRHLQFDDNSKACLMCTYLPAEEYKSHSQEVSDQLGLPDKEREIRDYLHYGRGLDEQLMTWICEANGIPLEDLAPYLGKNVSTFYAETVCGGTLLSLKKNFDAPITIEAPLAFQSTMAGILLSCELVMQKLNLRPNAIPQVSQFYTLKDIKSGINPNHKPFDKDESGRCVCRDEDFVTRYNEKWS